MTEPQQKPKSLLEELSTIVATFAGVFGSAIIIDDRKDITSWAIALVIVLSLIALIILVTRKSPFNLDNTKNKKSIIYLRIISFLLFLGGVIGLIAYQNHKAGIEAERIAQEASKKQEEDKTNRYLFKSDKIALLITRYSELSNELPLEIRDDLAKIVNKNTHDIGYLNRHFGESIFNPSFFKDYDSLDIKQGLIVSGRLNENDGLLYTYIGFKDFFGESGKMEDVETFEMKVPDIHSFSTDLNARTIVEFIKGLISYQEKDWYNAASQFISCLELSGSKENERFISYCSTLSANSLAHLNLYQDAKPRYILASQKYPDNVAAIENMIRTNYILGEIDEALENLNKYPQLSTSFRRKILIKIDQQKRMSGYLSLGKGESQDGKQELEGINMTVPDIIDAYRNREDQILIDSLKKVNNQAQKQRFRDSIMLSQRDGVIKELTFEQSTMDSLIKSNDNLIAELIDDLIKRELKIVAKIRKRGTLNFDDRVGFIRIPLYEYDPIGVRSKEVDELSISLFEGTIPEVVSTYPRPILYFRIEFLDDVANTRILGSPTQPVPLSFRRDGSIDQTITYNFKKFTGLTRIVFYKEVSSRLREFHVIKYTLK